MRELNAIVQVSLDGFVAGPNREFDNFVGGEENLEFVCSIIESADAAMFGRISYELLESAWPAAAEKPDATQNEIKYSNWYNAVTKYVFSKTLSNGNTSRTLILKDITSAEISKVKNQPGKDILLFGSPTIFNELLQGRILDHIWLIVHPVVFGSGIPLFRAGNLTSRFDLKASHQLQNGTLCNKYALLE